MGLLRPFCMANGEPDAYIISFAYDITSNEDDKVIPDYAIVAQNVGASHIEWSTVKILPLESNDWIKEAASRDLGTSFNCRAVSASSPTNPSGFVFTLNVRAGKGGEGPGFMVQISRLGDDMTGAALVVRNEAAPEGAPARKDDHFNSMSHLYQYPGIGSTEATVPWVDIRVDGKRIDLFTSHGLSFPYFPQWSMQMNETVWAITTNSTHLFIMSDASPCHRISTLPLILQTESNSTKVFVQGVEPSRAISRDLTAAECQLGMLSAPTTSFLAVGSKKLHALMIAEWMTMTSKIGGNGQWVTNFEFYQYNLINTINNRVLEPVRVDMNLYQNENRTFHWDERSLPLIPIHDPEENGPSRGRGELRERFFLGTTDQMGILLQTVLDDGYTRNYSSFRQTTVSVPERFKFNPGPDEGVRSGKEIALIAVGAIVLLIGLILASIWYRRWHLRKREERRMKWIAKALLEHKDVNNIQKEKQMRRRWLWRRNVDDAGGGGIRGSANEVHVGLPEGIDYAAIEALASAPVHSDEATPSMPAAQSMVLSLGGVVGGSSGNEGVGSDASGGQGNGIDRVEFSRHPRPRVAFVMGEEEEE